MKRRQRNNNPGNNTNNKEKRAEETKLSRRQDGYATKREMGLDNANKRYIFLRFIRCAGRLSLVLSVCLSVCLSVRLSISLWARCRYSSPARPLDSCDHNHKKTGSHSTPSRGRRVVSISDNPEAVSRNRASIAAGCTFQILNLVHWPVQTSPIGEIHANWCWLFLGGWYETGIGPAIDPAWASATRER